MSIVISSTSIKRRNGSFSGQVTNISGQEAYISRRGKTGSRRDTMGSISGRDTSTSTPDTTDTTSDQEQPCTHNHRLRRPSSFQRLSQNTASSSARMKTLRSVGVDSNGPAGLLMKRRPKAEMTSVIQHDLPYDSLGKFENQTELKAQDFDGTKSESYRSICMACTRQVACKPSLDGFEQSTQLRPSTPSSPIPTQHAPVIHSAEAHGQDWQGQFFALTTMLIRHSDQLQRLSLDLLKSDTKVKEVLLTGYDLADNYATQERKYENELLYYNNALKRQQALIDTLETLIQDVCTTPVAPGAHIPARHEENIAVPTSSCGITQVQGSFVTRIRWQISQLIGGCVGTGHVVNASCSNEEILILSGTGVLLEQFLPVFHNFVLYLDLSTVQEKYSIKTPSNWIPDAEVAHCQYAQTTEPCPVKFGCCGKIYCNIHSTNRLLLFHASSKDSALVAEWSRVCNTCFDRLAIRP